jgi:hypothetical protein
MTFHAFRLARTSTTTCPACEQHANPVLIAMYGQCGACTTRLQRALAQAADVLAQSDITLQFRATWATSILTAATGPRPAAPTRSLPPSRQFGGVR